MATDRLTVRVDDELQDQLATIVQSTGKSESQVVREALRDYIVKHGHVQTCRDIAAAHDAYMRSNNFPPELRLYCHGQGYDLVERPLVRSDETMALAAGMNLAVHPGYETDAMFAVICDNYLVEENGPSECLHETEKKIFEV